MAKPNELDIDRLNEEDRAYYDSLLTEDIESAEGFLQQAMSIYNYADEAIIDVDENPFGVGTDVTTPTDTLSKERALMDAERTDMFLNMDPVILDEAQREGYTTAVDYFKGQQYPDEDELNTQFRIEFENANGPIILKDKEYELGGTARIDYDSMFDQAQYDIQLLDYSQARLESQVAESGLETAQQKARSEFYGLTGPRGARAPERFTSKKTSTPVGMLQQRPEAIKEMSLTEAFAQALLPQVMVTGEDARAQDAQRRMWVERAEEVLFDYESEDGFGGEWEAYLENFNEMSELEFKKVLYKPQGIDPSQLTFGLDEAELDNLDEDLAEANKSAQNYSRVLVQEKIKDLHKFSSEFKEQLALEDWYDGTVESVLENTSLPQPDLSTGESIMKGIGDVFSQLTTAEDPEARQRLYRMGIAPDPDAITETPAMAGLRDINLVLRAVINPAMAQYENLGLIDTYAPSEELDTMLPAERIELTETANLIDLPSAFLKEILVETATMRGLGNDLASIKSVVGADVSPEYADYLVGAGTFAELFIPLLPKGTKVGSSIGSAVAKVSGKPMLGKLTTSTVKAFATGDIGLGTIRFAGDFVSGPATNALRNARLNRLTGVRQAADVAGTTYNPFKTPFEDTGKLSNTISDDLSKSMLELDVRRSIDDVDMADEIIASMLDETLINEIKFDGFSSQLAGETFEGYLKSDSKMIRNTADELNTNRNQFVEGRKVNFYDAINDEIDVIKGRRGARILGLDDSEDIAGLSADFIQATEARLVQGRQPVLELMRGTLLDDYVRLTDRVLVSEEWLKTNNAELSEFFINPETGGNRFVSRVAEDKILVNSDELFDFVENTGGFKVNGNDVLLNDIIKKSIDGDLISANEFAYLNSRLLEEKAFQTGMLDTVKVKKDVGLLERATIDPMQRSPARDWANFAEKEIRQGATAFARNAKQYIGRYSKEFIEETAKNTKILDDIGVNTVDSANFIDQVNQAVTRTGKTSSNVMSHVSQTLTADINPMGFSAMSPAERSYSGVLSLQAAGFDFSDILRMNTDAMQFNLIKTTTTIDDVGTTIADQALKDMLAHRAGSFSSESAIMDFIDNVQGNTVVDVNRYFKYVDEMTSMFPEIKIFGKVNEGGTGSLRGYEALNGFMLQKELRGQVSKAIQDNFMYRKVLPENSTALSYKVPDAKTGEMRPLVNSVQQQEKLIKEFLDIRIKHPDDSVAMSHIANILLREGLISDLKIPVRPKLKPFDEAAFRANNPPPQRPIPDAEFEYRIGRTSQTKKSLDAQAKARQRQATADSRYETRMSDAKQRSVAQQDVLAQKFIAEVEAAKAALENTYSQTRVYYNLISDGNVEHAIAMAKGTGLRSDATAAEILSSKRLQFEELQLQNVLLNPYEQKIISEVLSQIGDVNSHDVFMGNLNKVKKTKYDQDVTDAMSYLTYSLENFRRNWSTGQLGGKVLPNPTYLLENQMTAPLITYVTNPKYITTVMKQAGFMATGRVASTPYRQLRSLAATAPDTVFEGTRYTNKQLFDLYNQYNLGSSSAGINMGPNFRNDLYAMATQGPRGKEVSKLGKILNTSTKNLADMFLPGRTSPWMRMSDNLDRTFREAVFIKALQSGTDVRTAASQARRVVLDYGAMPQFMKQGVGRAALYFSFMYQTSVEMFKALMNPKGAQRVAALANWNRQQMRNTETWFGAGNRDIEPVWRTVSNTNPSVSYAYVRAPYVNTIASLSELGMGLYGQMSGIAEKPDFEDAVRGVQRYLYIPALDFVLPMLYQGRRTAPKNLIKDIKEEGALTTYINLLQSQGANPYYMYDRYNLGVRTDDDMKPGKATAGGKQFYFRDAEGYNRYKWDLFQLNVLGVNRMISEYSAMYSLSGIDDSEGMLHFESDEKGIMRAIDYGLVREREVIIPKQEQMKYRAFREQLRQIKDKEKEFK